MGEFGGEEGKEGKEGEVLYYNPKNIILRSTKDTLSDLQNR